MLTTWILIAVAIILAATFFIYYNRFVRLAQQIDNALSQIDVQLRKRSDLIPNLLSAVKGYMKHEEGVLTKVTEARAAAMGAKGLGDKAKAENMLSETLKSLFAVSESYPDLKASQNFLQLQDEISDTENKIQASRRFYNGQVRDFNTKIQTFPNNMVAGMLRFTKFEFFEADESEKENIEVKL